MAKLKAVLGTADATPTVLTDTPEGRTLGKAVTADVVVAGGNVVSVKVTDVRRRPVVGISWKKDSIGSDYQGFAEAFERNGAIAVFLPKVETAEQAQTILGKVNGIFMTGGEDWNTALYDEVQTPHGSSGPNDVRDTSDIHLMQQAVALNVPMLAVCRGEQGFNVAMGGGLIQDIPYYLGQKVISGEISPDRVSYGDLAGQPVDVDQDLCNAPLRALVKYAGIEMDRNNSGSNSGSSSSGGSGSSSSSTTTTNPDSSTTTKTENKTTGTVTETTKNPDGSKTVVETKKDGTSATVTTDTDGKVEAEVKLPAAAVSAAQKEDEAIALPIPEVDATKNTETAPAVTVKTGSKEPVKVEIPVADPTSGTVAVLVKDDGTEEIIKTSVPTETGVVVELSDGTTVKLVDNSKSFADVPSQNWAKDAVDFVSARELFSGTSEYSFSPETSMTRAMLMTVLARFDGADTNGGATWYEKGMNWAVANGVSDGSNPDSNVTREQLVTMLWRYSGSPAASGDLSRFPDADQTSGYALEAMRWAVENDIVSGFGSGQLGPQGQATRAQVAQMLKNFIEA